METDIGHQKKKNKISASLLFRADLGVNVLLGVAGCKFGEQDAWVDGFCISQTEPESGTDMERVTGGKRLCCGSGVLQEQIKQTVRWCYRWSTTTPVQCNSPPTHWYANLPLSFLYPDDCAIVTETKAVLSHLILSAWWRRRLSCCCGGGGGGGAELNTFCCRAYCCLKEKRVICAVNN